MGKAIVMGRGDAVVRWARAIQYVTGGVAVSVQITYADETDDSLMGDTVAATQYGDTSKGRPIGSLPADIAYKIAYSHLEQAGKALVEQRAKMEDHRAQEARAELEAKAKLAAERVAAIQRAEDGEPAVDDSLPPEQDVPTLTPEGDGNGNG